MSDSQGDKVRSLPVGSRFAWRGEVWKVDRNEPSYVEARAEQFSNRATFYDPVTARKSGDLCWDIAVSVLLRAAGAQQDAAAKPKASGPDA